MSQSEISQSTISQSTAFFTAHSTVGGYPKKRTSVSSFEKREKIREGIIKRRNKIELVLTISTVVFAIITAGAVSIFLDRKPHIFSLKILAFFHKAVSSKNIFITNIAIGIIITFGIILIGSLAVAGVHVGSIIHYGSKDKEFFGKNYMINNFLYIRKFNNFNDKELQEYMRKAFHEMLLYFNKGEFSAAKEMGINQGHQKKIIETLDSDRIISWQDFYNFIRDKMDKSNFILPKNLNCFFILISLIMKNSQSETTVDLSDILKFALVHEIIEFKDPEKFSKTAGSEFNEKISTLVNFSKPRLNPNSNESILGDCIQFSDSEEEESSLEDEEEYSSEENLFDLEVSHTYKISFEYQTLLDEVFRGKAWETSNFKWHDDFFGSDFKSKNFKKQQLKQFIERLDREYGIEDID